MASPQCFIRGTRNELPTDVDEQNKRVILGGILKGNYGVIRGLEQ